MVNTSRGKHVETNDETAESASLHWRDWNVLPGWSISPHYSRDYRLSDAHCPGCCRSHDCLQKRKWGCQHWFLPHASDISHSKDMVGQSQEATRRQVLLLVAAGVIALEGLKWGCSSSCFCLQTSPPSRECWMSHLL